MKVVVSAVKTDAIVLEVAAMTKDAHRIEPVLIAVAGQIEPHGGNVTALEKLRGGLIVEVRQVSRGMTRLRDA